MANVIETMELNCSKCYLTLKVRGSVSSGRLFEIANEQGWKAYPYDEEPVLCVVCRSGLTQMELDAANRARILAGRGG